MTTINFDHVLDATQASIYAENNDLGQINVDLDGAINSRLSNLRRIASGNSWDAAEYGITAQQAQAMIDNANTPEERAKVLAELQALAVQRASLDTTGGKVRVAVNVGPDGSKLPWHRLGTMVTAAMTSSEAARYAGLVWEVEKVPATYTWGGVSKESDSTYLLVRSDTGEQLGSTGRLYKPVQNADGFSFLDQALADYHARYETAGSLYNGKTVWMQAKLPEMAWEVVKGDRVETYATFTLCHDGTAACRCVPTTLRAVCANTLRVSLQGRKGKGISISHKGNLNAKIKQAQQALGLAVRSFEQFKEASSEMTRHRVDVVPYANRVLDQVLTVTEEQVTLGAELVAAAQAREAKDKAELAAKLQKEMDQRKALLNDILDRYHSDRCQPGTVWGAFNAVTEHADHYKSRQRGTQHDRDSRKMESVLYGKADDMKQVAYEYAIESMN